MWDASRCDLCGDCLVECRYVDYDRDRAVREIELLMDGKAAEILNSCITCAACNDHCPHDADPSNLIFKMQEKIGTSSLVVNARPLLNRLAQGIERSNGDSELIEGDPNKPVLSFDSFQFSQFPEGTLQSRLFKGMTVVRGAGYMSLVGCVHMGGESFAARYAGKVIERLAELQKDIVYIHNEGYVLAHLKAKELDIEVPFRYMHLFEYLRDYLDSNRNDITRLDKRVAYQPNCASRWLPEQDSWLTEILELIGVERPSRKYEGVNSLCCSAPVIASNGELAVEIQEKNVRDAIDCGADAMLTICPICDAVMRRPTSQLGIPKIFVTDLCRMALGEIPWPAG